MPSDDHPPDPSPTRPAADTPDPQVRAERAHLAESRHRLRAMRERVASLDAQSGDAVSAAHLQAALHHRMRALEDDPEVPLFFGRLDYLSQPPDRPAERLYVGRRHVTDADGDPMVIDWRAPVSRPFYRASATEPMGVGLRRRFGFDHGLLTAYEDEPLTGTTAEDASGSPGSPVEGILRSEIERPRVGPMRDIVATIQPDQDDIVRADVATSVLVQGAPGTGKTAVGLHRAAYLLYAFRDQLRRSRVLVVGPNESFLSYIGDVLPALGEIEASQTTVEGLLSRVEVRAEDPPAVAAVKSDPRLVEVVHRACWARVVPPSESLVVPRGSRRWRLAAYEVEDVVARLRERRVRYGAGRAMLPQQLAHAVLLKMEASGDSPDDRVQDAVARSREVKRYVDATWPKLDPAVVVHGLLSDPDLLARAAEDVLSAEEQALLRWAKPPRSVRSARWSVHDAALVDEAADLIDRTPSVGHVVLDEAQDLSPMMLRAVGRRCSTGSVTVLGDLAQTTSPWGTGDWARALEHLGKPDARVEQLTRGFRVPSDVIAYAARLLPTIAPTLRPPTSVRRTTDALRLERVADGRLVPTVVHEAARLAEDPGSVAVIAADADATALAAALADVGDGRVEVVPASLAKGLEFDHVVLVEPAAVVDGEADGLTGLRRLYVCLTRAVTSLVVVHARPLPPALDDAPGSTAAA